MDLQTLNIAVLLFKYKFTIFKCITVLQKCVFERELDFTGSVQNLYYLIKRGELILLFIILLKL